MADLTSKDSLPIFFGIVAVAISGFWLVRRKTDKQETPPMAPAGILTAITELSGDRAFLFTEEMAEATKSFIYRLRLPIPGGVVIIGDPFVQREMLLVMESAFEYSPTDEEYSIFTENLEISLREFTFRQSVNPLRQIIGFMLPETRRAVKACKNCREFVLKVLNTYRSNPNKSPQKTLIKLIDENSAFEDDDLKVSELLTYMVAGFDTTGYTLSTTLILLAQHPEVVKKARASMSGDGQMTDTIHHILAESNRFYPVAAMGSIRTLPRDLTALDRVSQRKYVISKGSNCFLPQYLPNRNKTVYGDDADVFRPDRWENATQEMNDARLMFALGSRNCIGQSLALAELQSVLPRLIQDYDFELVEPGHLNYFLTLKFHDSKIKLTKV